MHASFRGRLAVTAYALFGGRYVTPVVSEYLQRYPDVSASCLFLDRLVNLVDEEVDVAVRIGELADSSMQAIQVGKVRRIICASPNTLQESALRPSLPLSAALVSPDCCHTKWPTICNVDGFKR